MRLLYLLLSETFKQQPSQNSHLCNEEAKPRTEMPSPFLNSTIYSYSHLLVIVIKAILCITAVTIASVFTVIFYLWLHWITAKRAHPFSPAKQGNKNFCQILSETLSKTNLRNQFLQTSLILNQYYNSRQSETHCTRCSSKVLNLFRSVKISDSTHCTFSNKKTKWCLKTCTSSVCSCIESSSVSFEKYQEKIANSSQDKIRYI